MSSGAIQNGKLIGTSLIGPGPLATFWRPSCSCGAHPSLEPAVYHTHHLAADGVPLGPLGGRQGDPHVHAGLAVQRHVQEAFPAPAGCDLADLAYRVLVHSGFGRTK